MDMTGHDAYLALTRLKVRERMITNVHVMMVQLKMQTSLVFKSGWVATLFTVTNESPTNAKDKRNGKYNLWQKCGKFLNINFAMHYQSLP